MSQILTLETHPPTCVNLAKLWEESICEWPLNRAGFSLILKISHALGCLLSVLSRLHGRKHKRMHFLLNEASLNKRDYFEILLPGILCMEPNIYFQI